MIKAKKNRRKKIDSNTIQSSPVQSKWCMWCFVAVVHCIDNTTEYRCVMVLFDLRHEFVNHIVYDSFGRLFLHVLLICSRFFSLFIFVLECFSWRILVNDVRVCVYGCWCGCECLCHVSVSILGQHIYACKQRLLPSSWPPSSFRRTHGQFRMLVRRPAFESICCHPAS